MINYRPVIIVGAPRSGTNMLRDVLCSMPGVETWPCDEINYIWRHGNIRHKSDELLPEMAKPEVEGYIRKKFDGIASTYNANYVVEKTCANSLRIPFVREILPDAKYIFIRRDGVDAVGSAMKRWKAELDISYLIRKAQFVPLSDIPYYGSRYLWNRLYRFFSREERLAFWGPKFNGMDELLATRPLDEVCALQWQACVDKASDALALLPEERWIEVGYEKFVQEPEKELARLLDFVGMDVPAPQLKEAVVNVRADSIGKGRAALDSGTVARLEELVNETLSHYGYI